MPGIPEAGFTQLMPSDNPRTCFVVAVEITVKAFLIDHIRALSPFFSVNVALNTHNTDFLKPLGVDVPVLKTGIEREISLISDVISVIELYKLFRQERYDIIHSVTPKAGLLSMVAGYFAGIPVRIHIFTGQVWATRKGPGRWLLKTLDRILALCATHILVDSQSQRSFLAEQGVVSLEKSRVLANGSICGVDSTKFSPNQEARYRIRKQFGIMESDIVFMYLGRLNRDKGLLDLARSFSQMCNKYGNVRLIVVGPDEQGMKEQIQSICTSCRQKTHFVDYTDVPEQYIASADVFCLPSYREGFGVVIIQAASAGIPSIGSRIYGITDTIEDGITGLLFEAGNKDDLSAKMEKFLENPLLVKQMGAKARERALQLYSKEKVTGAMLDFYKNVTVECCIKKRTAYLC